MAQGVWNSERILTRQSHRGALLMLIASLCVVRAAVAQRQAELPWWDRAEEQQIGVYWMKSDVPPEQANALARHLNLMYREYAKRLGHLSQRNEEKLNVLMFHRRQDYLLTLRARFGIDATGTGGMFFVNRNGGALAFWTESLPEQRIHHVIQHEGFHQFAWALFGTDLPIWVNEGLAEFFGESVLVNGQFIIGQSTPRVIDRVKEAIELNEYIPFQRMLTMDNAQWSEALRNGSAAMQYHQAWSMVHFLVYGNNGRYVDAFEHYLRLLNQGFRSDVAFTRAFGPDIEAFEKRWITYAQNARPSAYVTALERLEFLAEGMLELASRNVYPESLEDMKAALREIDFSYDLVRHGVTMTLSAADDAMFIIPRDDLTSEQPVIIVEKPAVRRMPIRERVLEEQNPTPPDIRTEHLEPRNAMVQWVRDRETNTFGYEITPK